MIETKNVCFTSFNLEIDWQNLNIDQIDTKKQIKYIIYQGELCQDGKKHIQGFIQFHKKKRFTAIKKLLNDNTIHLEPMKGTPEQAYKYCTDEYIDKNGEYKKLWFNQIEYGELDTTTERQRTDLINLKDKIVEGKKLNKILIDSEDNTEIHNILQYNKTLKTLEQNVRRISIKEELIKDYQNVVWNDIQKKILELVEEKPDTRKVHWIYDEYGNNGKSYIAKYLQLQYDTYYITGGKQNDILYGYDGEPIVIIDLARTYADNLEHIYTIIENLKNGMYLSTKYETIQKIFKIPTIIVMANFKPDIKKLSSDRWDIIDTEDYQKEIFTNVIEQLQPIKRLALKGSATS
jgi:Mor family transcriptional regulator